MMIGTLAITGVGIPLTHYGFAGFVSKDAIIESAFAGGTGAAGVAFWALVVAALFTSFYSWRLMFMTFYGEPRGDHHTHEHAHESPMTMLVPLGVLAFGAVFAGMVWYKPFFGSQASVDDYFGIEQSEGKADDHAGLLIGAAFAAGEDDHGDDDHGEARHQTPGVGAIYAADDNHVIHAAHGVPKWVKVAPFIVMLLGFGLALAMYVKDAPKSARAGLGLVAGVVLLLAAVPWYWAVVIGGVMAALLAGVPYGANRKLAENQPYLYNFLLNKWYVDEIYDFLFVNPAKAVGRFLWKKGDMGTIDGFLNGVAMGIVPFFTRLAGKAQSGYIFTYAFWMVLGILVLISWMSIGGAN